MVLGADFRSSTHVVLQRLFQWPLGPREFSGTLFVSTTMRRKNGGGGNCVVTDASFLGWFCGVHTQHIVTSYTRK